MRKMKDSGVEWIGEIPEGWEVKRIKSIFKVIPGSTPKSDNTDFWEGKNVWITPVDFSEHTVHISKSKKYLTEAGLAAAGLIILPKGSIVITTRAPIGEVALADSDFCTNQGCKSLIKQFTLIEKFFYYCLFINKDILNTLGNGSTFLELSTVGLENFILPYPPILDQQKISSYLDHKCAQIDAILANIRQSIDKLKEYRQAVITRAVTKGLDPDAKMKDSGVEWIGEIPEGWEVKRLKNISALSPPIPITLSENQEVSFLPMENIKNGTATLNTVNIKEVINKTYNVFSNNDILVAKVTPCFENGNIAIAENVVNEPGFATTEIFVIRASGCHIKFLFYFFQSQTFKERAISTMTGTGGLKRVSPQFMRDEKMAIPDYQAQQKICAYLDHKCAKIDSLISEKQKLCDKFTAYKKSLIYEYVTGKREVPEGWTE